MSVFVAYIVESGIVFAADKNITYDDGTKTWQQTGRKVFRSSTGDALVGYVGAAQTASGVMMDTLLPDFLSRNAPVSDPGTTARALQAELQAQMDPTEQSIVQFAAFGDHVGVRLPEYWHIANVHGMDPVTGMYDAASPSFGCSEEFLSKCRGASTADSAIRTHLHSLAAS